MGGNKQSGFTIIEISLFFAVSALLLFTMMVGITIAVQRQRFSDSVNSAQSFLQQQFNETQTTINNRANSNCGVAADRGTSDCLVLGKIIDLQPASNTAEDNNLDSFNVITNADLPTGADNMNDITLLDAINPLAVRETNNDQAHIVAWGAQITTVRDSAGALDSGGATPVRYVLILRSPTTGLIHTYKLTDQDDLFSTGVDTSPLAGNIARLDGTTGQSVKACITSADLVGVRALLKIEEGASQDTVTTQFDTDEARQWCV